MAIALPVLAFVRAAQRLAPSVFIVIPTSGAPVTLLNWSFASVITSPSSGALPLAVVTLIAYKP